MAEPFRPLAGVTVLAWEQAVSLPFATRMMADLGANVVRLEAHGRVAPRPRYLGNDLMRNKRSVAVNLRDDRGQELVRELVRKADIFCENYTPRVQRQFGLTYDRLRQYRPDLIMLSLTGYGQTGDWSERPTYGPGIESAAGHAMSAGHPDQPPTRPGTIVYADNISGSYAFVALMAALHHRRQTGEGRFIDLAMYEALAFHLAIPITRSSLTGAPEPRRGNGEQGTVLQDVFASKDGERWVALTVWPGDESKAATVAPGSGELRERLRAWIATNPAEYAAAVLQAAGIAASVVANAKDLWLDPQLRHRAAFSMVQHANRVNGHGAHPHLAPPWKVPGAPRVPLEEAPSVGQHSEAVLREWLGMGAAEIQALEAAGVVGVSSGEGAPVTSALSPERVRQHLEWRLIAGFDPDPLAVISLGSEVAAR